MSAAALTWGRHTWVMGIINITPDSFSGDGLLLGGLGAPLAQARAFIDAGADILDVGGESTRPGAEPVSLEDEIARVVPAISAIRDQFPGVCISIDTSKAGVAEAAIRAGASMINDIWGLKADLEMAGVAARHNVPVVVMHNRSSWANAEIKERLGGRYVGVPYQNLLEDIKRELLE